MKFRMISKFFVFPWRRWLKMKVDKVFIDPSSGRYHVLLKSKNPEDGKVFLHSGFLLEENTIFTLFFKHPFSKKFFSMFGIKLKCVKIIKKINTPDSALCVFKVGLFTKKVYMSSLEALRLAYENEAPIKVNIDVLGINFYNLGEFGNLKYKVNNVFLSKTTEESSINPKEVIM
jgi:hypothetical protein